MMPQCLFKANTRPAVITVDTTKGMIRIPRVYNCER
jgi:hypothetical protein